MKSVRKVIFLLTILLEGKMILFAQPIYNNCFQALEICPNTTTSINNIGANKSFCPDCEDDFIFCFTSNNSIWLKFTTNTMGGDVQIDFSNLVFQTGTNQDSELQATIFSTIQPCQGNSYVQIGNCVSNATGNFSLNALSLDANTTYYIVISGDKTGVGITTPAECTFNLLISGPGVNRITPTISIYTNSLNVCKNDVVTFIANMDNCTDSTAFLWYVNGVLVATTTDSVYQTTDLETNDVVSVSTTCFTLCPQTINATTSAFSVSTFSVDAGLDSYLATGQSAQLQGVTDAPFHIWSPGSSLSSTSLLNTIAVPSETTTYTLTVTDSVCTAFDEVIVFVEQELIIPTTFSPNNDGINDVWEIIGIESYPNCFVRIYDRWGQEVFQKTGYSLVKAWKGDVHERELSSSVYFYVLELRDKDKQIKKGSVTVLR